jgi:1,4-dihydroxy-2-naphthoyl-CoA synthase
MGKRQYQDIIYERSGHRARIPINRPEVLNAFRDRTCEEFCFACGEATADPDIGVLVITGAGTKAFSLGGDVRSYEVKPGEESNMPAFGANVYKTIRKVTKPPIAIMRGWCIGGANVLAAQCDITIASVTARFGPNGPRVPGKAQTRLLEVSDLGSQCRE